MSQSLLSKWLKAIIIALALGGLFVCFWVLPAVGMQIKSAYPEFSYCYYPWLIFLWVTAMPCYMALAFAWRIAKNIEQNRAFTKENGKMFAYIANAAAADSIFFTSINVLYLILDLSHPSIILLSFVIGLIGGAVSVICSGLSTLVNNATALQEQSDLTI